MSRRSYTVISGRGSALERAPLSRPSSAGALLAFCVWWPRSSSASISAWSPAASPRPGASIGRRPLTIGRWCSPKSDHLGHSVALCGDRRAWRPRSLADARGLPRRPAGDARRVASVDFLCVLPAAVPGVFLGIGYLLIFNRPGIPLAGTAAVLVLAFTFANLPFGYQVIRAGLAQIDRISPTPPPISAPRACASCGTSTCGCSCRRAWRPGRQPSSAASPISASRSSWSRRAPRSRPSRSSA